MTPFTIERRPGLDVLRVRMLRLFSADDAHAMMNGYADVLAGLRSPVGMFDLLVDVGDAPIQSGEVVRSLTDYIDRPEHRPARIAFVHGDKAIRMQARRMSAELGGRSFVTEAEAMAWFAVERRAANA